MMKREKKSRHYYALLGGIILLVAETWMNVQEMSERAAHWYDSSIVAAVVVCFAASYALYAAEDAFFEREYGKAVFLLTAFIFGAAFQFSTSLDRVATQRDYKLINVWRADKEWMRLTNVEEKMSNVSSRECGKFVGTRSRGNACLALEEEEKIANLKRKKREAELDSLGQRVSSMFPWLSVEAASKYVPTFLPLALFFLANSMFLYGGAGQKVREEFDTSPAGRLANEERVLRYLTAYFKNNGQFPETKIVVEKMQVSEFVARRLIKTAMKKAA